MRNGGQTHLLQTLPTLMSGVLLDMSVSMRLLLTL